MAEPLTTVGDVAARLGRDFTASEVGRLWALVEDVSAAVRGFTGRRFATGPVTVRSRVVDGRVAVPDRGLTAIVSVATVAGVVVPFAWDGLGPVDVTGAGLPSANWAAPSVQVVDVTYTTAGAVPDEVRGLCAQIVVRSLGRDPLEAGLQQESIAGYSYTVGASGAAGPFGLLPDERAALTRWRLPAIGTVWMAEPAPLRGVCRP